MKPHVELLGRVLTMIVRCGLKHNTKRKESRTKMPSGNGAKAKQKRERNQAKADKQKGGVSQLKANEKALSLLCSICKVQSFHKSIFYADL